MPRTARASVGGLCYHVINRGNGKARIYHSEDDYRSFTRLIGRACERVPLRVLGYCLMPNHFHLVLWPYGDGDMSRWMHWLMTAHVRRYHRKHGTTGRIWQGRFKAFPIQSDGHLLTVLRYVERNPLRANLVSRAEDWPWSSMGAQATRERARFLHSGPVERRDDWIRHVNSAMTAAEMKALRRCVQRESPFGNDMWVRKIAAELGLESSLRPTGRPRKHRATED